jgi:cytidine deaminase
LSIKKKKNKNKTARAAPTTTTTTTMPATTTTPTPHPPTAESIAATRATHHHLTPSEFETLRARAQAAKARAHCPYSRFRVGGALLTRAGDVVVGANVENASYPVGTCAERVAFGTAVVGGYFDKAGEGGGEGEGPVVRALAVATDVEGPASPCGMCRQL